MSALSDTHEERRRTTRPVWEEKPTLLLSLGKGTTLTLVVLAVLFPMWSIVVTSLASRETINRVRRSIRFAWRSCIATV